MKVRSKPQPNAGLAQDRIWCIHAWRRCSVVHPDGHRVVFIRCMHCLAIMGMVEDGRPKLGMPIAFGEQWTPRGVDRRQSRWLGVDDRSPVYQWPTVVTAHIGSPSPTFSRATTIRYGSTEFIYPVLRTPK